MASAAGASGVPGRPRPLARWTSARPVSASRAAAGARSVRRSPLAGGRPMTQTREGSLLAWQWSIYPGTHHDRRNLLVHALTVPVFQVGTVALVVGPFVSLWLSALGLAGMAGAMLAQGRSHRLEQK